MKRLEDQQPQIDRIREAGLRATASRVAILDHLQEDRRHPTAEMVYESLRAKHPSLSLSTVYSTLESFIDRGLLRRVHTPEGRLRVDGTLQDHDHAICRHCGAVFDVARTGLRPQEAPMLPEGVSLVAVNIEYEVLCSECQEHTAVGAGGSGRPGETNHPGDPGFSKES